MDGVFGTALHPYLFVIIILEVIMLIAQSVLVLMRPTDKGRWMLLFLQILIIYYNITGGLFYDPTLNISQYEQMIYAYTGGVSVSLYFVFYSVTVFKLQNIRRQALLGGLIFILVPIILIIGIVYYFTDNYNLARQMAVLFPGAYAIYWLIIFYKSIKQKYSLLAKNNISDRYKKPYFHVLTTAFIAQFFWCTLVITSYFNSHHLIEHTFTNLGYFLMFFAYVRFSVIQSWDEHNNHQTMDEQLKNALVLRDKSEVSLNESILANNILQRQLNSSGIHIALKNKSLTQIQQTIGSLSLYEKRQFNSIYEEVEEAVKMDKQNELLEIAFNKQHPRFNHTILSQFPNLSKKNLDLLIYMKLDLTNLEIAELLSISPNSVRQTKHRLAKIYMKLQGTPELEEILDSIP